jgi:sulfite dehydrogenase
VKKYLLILLLILLSQVVGAETIQLIQDTVQWRKSNLPGYQLTIQNCSACHSVHYAEYQPPNSGKAYWDATVKKMKTVFKAPIPDEDIQPIVEYLTQNYGANRK